MAFGLLGAHVNATIHGVPELIADWKPPLVVVLDHGDAWHDVKATSPKTVFVGRNYLASEPDFNNPDLDPVQAARDLCSQILPWAEKMGTTYGYWQGVNEPILNSADAMRRFAGFETERARILKDHGFRVVVGSFSVGHPTKMAHWKHFLPALEAAHQFKGALALHEYAWPTLDREWPWYLLRHRKVYEGEPEHQWRGLPQHLRTLPLFITECGLDGLIEVGHPPRGFRALHGDNPEPYLRELAWYSSQLKKDEYVRGAAIYCCGGSGPAWSTYDIWPEPAGLLARQATPIYRKRKPKPPKPKPAKPKPVTPAPEPEQPQPVPEPEQPTPAPEEKPTQPTPAPELPPQATPAPEPEPEIEEGEKKPRRWRFRPIKLPAIPFIARSIESLRARFARLAPGSRRAQSEDAALLQAGEEMPTVEGEGSALPEPQARPAATSTPAMLGEAPVDEALPELPARPEPSGTPITLGEAAIDGAPMDEAAMMEQLLERLDVILDLLKRKL